MPARKARSRKEITDQQFREKVDAAAKSFWFDVEKLRESTSLDTRETIKSLSDGAAKESALYQGAKLWQEQCLPSLKTLLERLQKLAVEYPEQFSNARQRSTWPFSRAVGALQELCKFSGDSSIFHTWVAGAVKEIVVTPNHPYPEKIEPDWYRSRGLRYEMPSALAAMFRSLEDELRQLNRNSLFDERQQETKTAPASNPECRANSERPPRQQDKKSVTTKEKLSSPDIDSAPPVTSVPASPELSRSERVDAFLRGLRKDLEGAFNRDEFCTVADVDPAELRRWQRNSPKTSKKAAKRIEDALAMKSEEFRRELNSQR